MLKAKEEAASIAVKGKAPEPEPTEWIGFYGDNKTLGDEYHGSDGPKALDMKKGQVAEVFKSTSERLRGTWPRAFKKAKAPKPKKK